MKQDALLAEAREFQTKRHLGQNFLVDCPTLDIIAGLLDLSQGDRVVEIGAGIGFLTRILAASGASITAVDLDVECTDYLESLELGNVEILHGDFLRFDLSSLTFFTDRRNENLSKCREGGRKPKVIGNVPYQITGRIIAHLLGEIGQPAPWFKDIERIVLTVQLEVARRMVACAGEEDYSRLSLLIAYFCQASLEAVVDRQCFYPSPEVTSAIVRLTPLKQPGVTCKNHILLRQLIEAGFRQRRKMLRNSLSFLKLGPQELGRVFASVNFDPQVRAERLSLQQFAKLADALS